MQKPAMLWSSDSSDSPLEFRFPRVDGPSAVGGQARVGWRRCRTNGPFRPHDEPPTGYGSQCHKLHTRVHTGQGSFVLVLYIPHARMHSEEWEARQALLPIPCGTRPTPYPRGTSTIGIHLGTERALEGEDLARTRSCEVLSSPGYRYRSRYGMR